MKSCKFRLMAGVLLAGLTLQSHAQVNAIDSVMNHVKGNKLSVGGYGEVGYTAKLLNIRRIRVMESLIFPMQ